MFNKQSYRKVTGYFHLSPFTNQRPEFLKPFSLIIETDGIDVYKDTYKDLVKSRALEKHITFKITKVEEL